MPVNVRVSRGKIELKITNTKAPPTNGRAAHAMNISTSEKRSL